MKENQNRTEHPIKKTEKEYETFITDNKCIYLSNGAR
jgi:hypothetical protein